jgi:hypothetical protein
MVLYSLRPASAHRAQQSFNYRHILDGIFWWMRDGPACTHRVAKSLDHPLRLVRAGHDCLGVLRTLEAMELGICRARKEGPRDKDVTLATDDLDFFPPSEAQPTVDNRGTPTVESQEGNHCLVDSTFADLSPGEYLSRLTEQHPANIHTVASDVVNGSAAEV